MKCGRPRKQDALGDYERDTFLRGANVHGDIQFDVSADGHRLLRQLENPVAPKRLRLAALVERDERLADWTAVAAGDALGEEEHLLARNMSSYDVEPDPDLCQGPLADEQRKRYKSSVRVYRMVFEDAANALQGLPHVHLDSASCCLLGRAYSAGRARRLRRQTLLRVLRRCLREP
jgi:hypothetical protein